jgi:hypothetical protein
MSWRGPTCVAGVTSPDWRPVRQDPLASSPARPAGRPASYRTSFTVRRRRPLPGAYLISTPGHRRSQEVMADSTCLVSGAPLNNRWRPGSTPKGSVELSAGPRRARSPVHCRAERRGARCRARSRSWRPGGRSPLVRARSSHQRHGLWRRPGCLPERRSRPRSVGRASVWSSRNRTAMLKVASAEMAKATHAISASAWWHPQGAVQPDDLTVEHAVVDDVSDQRGELAGAAQT